MPGLDRSLDRRQLLSVLGTASVASIAGCSSNEPEGANPDYTREDTPTDSPTPTETETEEPVSYPREISQDELDSTEIEEIYTPNDWGEDSVDVEHAKKYFFDDVDFAAIEDEYDDRREQIKEVLYQTTSETRQTRVNGHVGIIALQQLSWVNPEQGEQLIADEGTIRKGGEGPVIEIMYKDKEGNHNLEMLSQRGTDTHIAFEDNYYENPGESKLASDDYHVTAMANIEGVKDLFRWVMEDTGSLGPDERSASNNFVLGMNQEYKGRIEKGVTPETVKSVTLSEDYWQQFDHAFHQDPKQYKEMKVELSQAAANIDVEAGHAVNATVNDGKRIYEEITGETYKEIAPQLEL